MSYYSVTVRQFDPTTKLYLYLQQRGFEISDGHFVVRTETDRAEISQELRQSTGFVDVQILPVPMNGGRCVHFGSLRPNPLGAAKKDLDSDGGAMERRFSSKCQPSLFC